MYPTLPCFFPQVRLLDPTTRSDTRTTLLIEKDCIQIGISQDSLPENITIESAPVVLGPGLIDLYSHSGEPGYEDRETLTSLQKAAEAGGFAQVVLLPNTHPPIDTVATVDFFRNYPFLLWGAITQRCAGEQLTEFQELANYVVGFGDGKPIGNLLLLRRALEYAYPLGKPLLLMPQDRQLADGGVAREGRQSLRLGLAGIPIAAETTALASLLELVRLIPVAVHFMRVSCRESIPFLAKAKEEGLPITASVSWYHLIWETTELENFNPYFRVNPPLGEETDRQALINGLKTGVIDGIAIDHTPYTYEEKMVPLEVAPPGMIGLEMALPILWQKLVEPGQLTALELWQALSTAPARCLGITLPSQKTLLFPQKEWQINSLSIASLSQNTPLWGQTIQGKAYLLKQGVMGNL